MTSDSVDMEELRFALRIKMSNLAKKHLVFEKFWIENKKCDCVSEMLQGRALVCEHIEEALKEEFKEEEKETDHITSLIIEDGLRSNPKLLNYWLQGR